MSTTNQTPGSSRATHYFSAIFQVALNEYERVTGKPLRTHPLATHLDSCDSPQAVSSVLRAQVQAFSKFRKHEEPLMAWLEPTVHILSTFSATLGEGIGLVSRFIHPLQTPSDFLLSVILTRANYFHGDQCSSRSRSCPKSLAANTSNILTHRQQGMLWRTTRDSFTSSSAFTSSFNVSTVILRSHSRMNVSSCLGKSWHKYFPFLRSRQRQCKRVESVS
jgi:hypothetical protein